MHIYIIYPKYEGNVRKDITLLVNIGYDTSHLLLANNKKTINVCQARIELWNITLMVRPLGTRPMVRQASLWLPLPSLISGSECNRLP